jgi:hypothetical protein
LDRKKEDKGIERKMMKVYPDRRYLDIKIDR